MKSDNEEVAPATNVRASVRSLSEEERGKSFEEVATENSAALEETAPIKEQQVVSSTYQPTGNDPFHGRGGSYELDPETGVRRPVSPQ